METSNLIALGALLVAIIGLIPQFYQSFNKNKQDDKKNKNSKSRTKNKSSINDDKLTSEIPQPEIPDKPIPFMLRILTMVVMAVAIFLIEIIIFSGIAYLANVKVNLQTMPLTWQIVFYSLFLIPGILLVFACYILVANTED